MNEGEFPLYSEEISIGSKQELSPTDEDVLFSAWSPDGKKIAYVKRDATDDGIWNIWVKEVGNDVPAIQITQSNNNSSYKVYYRTPLAWSTNGKRVFYEAYDTSTTKHIIMAAESDASFVKTILSDTENTFHWPDFSRIPLDNKLLYCINLRYPYSIELDINSDPIYGTEINIMNFSAVHPKWSYPTKKIVFMQGVFSDLDIYVLLEIDKIIKKEAQPPDSLDDSRVIPIIENDIFSMASGFSFDEKLIFYFEDVNGVFSENVTRENTPVSDWVKGCDFDLFVTNADGSGVAQKINDQSYNQAYMVASPDGTWISFITDENGPDFDIYYASLVFSENITTEGGTVADASGTTVDIPPGALSETQKISIETPLLNNLPPSTIPFVTARDFGPDGLIFNEPVTITIRYTDASIEGYNEEDLQIYYYDENTTSWESLGGAVDKVHNKITTQVSHFSIFAVGEKKKQK